MNATRGTFAGAVLAGGESRRMGRDKARLRIGGELLWQRQVRVLRAAGADPVTIVQRHGQRALARNVRCVRDEFEGAGPLAAVHAALGAVEARWVAVVAVDMPSIEARWFTRLLKLCRAGCGVVGRSARGLEPLAAIYPVEARGLAERRLRAGQRSMQEFAAALAKARRMKVVRIGAGKAGQLRNWNTPADLNSGPRADNGSD